MKTAVGVPDSSVSYATWQDILLLELLISDEQTLSNRIKINDIWAVSSEFGTCRLCEQRRFRRACACAQSRQNLRCSLIQAVSQEEPSDRKPDPWPLWMAGHAQLKFVMTECSKTQIRLTRPIFLCLLLTIIRGGARNFERGVHKILGSRNTVLPLWHLLNLL